MFDVGGQRSERRKVSTFLKMAESMQLILMILVTVGIMFRERHCYFVPGSLERV